MTQSQLDKAKAYMKQAFDLLEWDPALVNEAVYDIMNDALGTNEGKKINPLRVEVDSI